VEEMKGKEAEKDELIALAREILGKCHPDAVTVIRHWITIIQSRWEEVSDCSNQVTKINFTRPSTW
jgi:dystonin